jgi:hypothetical protein
VTGASNDISGMVHMVRKYGSVCALPHAYLRLNQAGIHIKMATFLADDFRLFFTGLFFLTIDFHSNPYSWSLS